MTRTILRSSSTVLIIGLSAWLPLTAAGGPADRDVRVLARVGSGHILVSDLQREQATARRRSLAANRLDAFTRDATKKMLDDLIAVKLLAAGAREARMDERADVRDEIARVIDLVLAQAMTAEITSGVDTREPALRAYYNAHLDQFQVPGRVKARHLVVKTQAEAVALLGRVKRNADMAALARDHNTDASREKAGDLGWVSRGVMVKPFEDALFSLQVGGISPIVQTAHGFHIIKAEQIEPPRPKPFEAVSVDVRNMLVAGEASTVRAALAKKHPVVVNDAVLASLR